jgi:hypothetical protein
MICNMHSRIATFVVLLGLASTATSRSAFAQQPADGTWFDGSANSAPPPADEAAQQPPDYGPPGVQPAPDPSAPPPQGAGPAPQDNVPETDPRALTEFRPALDPYGTWIEDDKYGTVWVPNPDTVGDDFAPYVSAGHWALTEDGDWTWQSDYPFGGVVFHYGRWVWVPGTGWAWVAGRRYANAWVNWRVPTDDDYGYVGWAPMPPAWGWYGGSAISLGWYPPAPYVFCPSGYAFSYNVHSYIVHDRYVIHDIAGHTRNYSPGVGGGHLAATPRVLPANSAAPRGPTLQSAHIPANAVPSSRLAGGSAFSNGRSRGTASALHGNPYVRGDGSYGVSRPSSGSAYGTGARPYSNPSGYARSTGYATPSTNYSRSTNYQAPQRSYYSAPSAASRAYYAAPATHYSAPSTHYSVPTRSYSAPSTHYSAPARSYSAPSRSYSAPSSHYSHSRR